MVDLVAFAGRPVARSARFLRQNRGSAGIGGSRELTGPLGRVAFASPTAAERKEAERAGIRWPSCDGVGGLSFGPGGGGGVDGPDGGCVMRHAPRAWPAGERRPGAGSAAR